MANQPPSAEECTVKILLRDISRDLVTRWGCQEAFGDAKFKDLVEVYLCVQFNPYHYMLVGCRYPVETYLKVPQLLMQ